MKAFRSAILRIMVTIMIAVAFMCAAQGQNPPPASLGGFDSQGNAYLPQNHQYIQSGSWTFLTSAYSNATTSFTASALVMPPVPAGVTVPGKCTLFWQTNNTSGTLTLGLGLSNSTSSVQVLNTSHTGANGATLADNSYSVSGTTVTAISPALTPGAASTIYRDDVDLLLSPGTGNTFLTIYGKSSSASYTVSLMPGSKCVWGS